MPCMGPTRDREIAGLVVAELRKSESFDWDHLSALWAIEGAVERALTAKWGHPPSNAWRLEIIASLCYGLLYRRQPGEIDWEASQAALDDSIWMRDAADF